MNTAAIKKIAIVGSGISGLTAAHLLHDKYEITVFEKADYVGGHTHTVKVKSGEQEHAIDTGFIVFNDRTYPQFNRLLDKLGVAKQPSNMSFSFHSSQYAIQYAGNSLRGLFAQKRNLVNPFFYRLLNDIRKFNRQAKQFLQESKQLISLQEFLQHGRYGNWFRNFYLNPMAAAIWSMAPVSVATMPARFILDFYDNHGLLNIRKRPQWFVVKGGSKQYVDVLIKPFQDKIRLNAAVQRIERDQVGVKIVTDTDSEYFDAVVIASHSDQALSMLAEPSQQEYEILKNIPYTSNKVVLHTDTCVLPSRAAAWASWNYYDVGNERASLTYYMNKLQSIQSATKFCVSVNIQNIDPDKILDCFSYEHPQFNHDSVVAKQAHLQINGKQNTFYTGAYWGNGFHEDGVQASLRALACLGVTL